MAGTQISLGVGVDVQVSATGSGAQHVIVSDIARGLPLGVAKFDHVVMLAVLEHLAEPERVLEKHIDTRPGRVADHHLANAAVDPVLHVLHGLGIVSAEMESDKHERRIPLEELQDILLRIGFQRGSHRTFEFGLNNLLVAHKTG